MAVCAVSKIVCLLFLLIPIVIIHYYVVKVQSRKLIQIILFVDFLFLSTFTNQYISTSVAAVVLGIYLLAALYVLKVGSKRLRRMEK